MSRIASFLAAAAAALAACRGHADDNCKRAVDHLMGTIARGSASPEERAALDAVTQQTLAQCRKDGLADEIAACILAAHEPDFDDQLRACPAFAAKPPSWVILRPTREERATLLGRAPVPDGPRESSLVFRHLVGWFEQTCGLADGSAACWGQPLAVALPAGRFVQIAFAREQACGLDADGHLHCAVAAHFTDHAPADPVDAFAVGGADGCAILRADHSLACWSDAGAEPPIPPHGGGFTQIAMSGRDACALDALHTLTCFGDDSDDVARSVAGVVQVGGGDELAFVHDGGSGDVIEASGVVPPAGPLVQLSCSREVCCGVTRDHGLACTGERIGQPPAGAFDEVAVFRDHACAVRATGGGTICWGENDGGGCNVPQPAGAQRAAP